MPMRGGGMLSRRQFCVLAVGAGSAGLGLAGYSRNSGEEPPASQRTNGSAVNDLVLASRKSTALGTAVSIDVLHTDRGQAEQAISAAFDELRIVEQVMSLYLPESQLCRLNREGVLRDPHPYLVEVLQCARCDVGGERRRVRHHRATALGVVRRGEEGQAVAGSSGGRGRALQSGLAACRGPACRDPAARSGNRGDAQWDRPRFRRGSGGRGPAALWHRPCAGQQRRDRGAG